MLWIVRTLPLFLYHSFWRQLSLCAITMPDCLLVWTLSGNSSVSLNTTCWAVDAFLGLCKHGLLLSLNLRTGSLRCLSSQCLSSNWIKLEKLNIVNWTLVLLLSVEKLAGKPNAVGFLMKFAVHVKCFGWKKKMVKEYWYWLITWYSTIKWYLHIISIVFSLSSFC